MINGWYRSVPVSLRTDSIDMRLWVLTQCRALLLVVATIFLSSRHHVLTTTVATEDIVDAWDVRGNRFLSKALSDVTASLLVLGDVVFDFSHPDPTAFEDIADRVGSVGSIVVIGPGGAAMNAVQVSVQAKGMWERTLLIGDVTKTASDVYFLLSGTCPRFMRIFCDGSGDRMLHVLTTEIFLARTCTPNLYFQDIDFNQINATIEILHRLQYRVYWQVVPADSSERRDFSNAATATLSPILSLVATKPSSASATLGSKIRRHMNSVTAPVVFDSQFHRRYHDKEVVILDLLRAESDEDLDTPNSHDDNDDDVDDRAAARQGKVKAGAEAGSERMNSQRLSVRLLDLYHPYSAVQSLLSRLTTLSAAGKHDDDSAQQTAVEKDTIAANTNFHQHALLLLSSQRIRFLIALTELRVSFRRDQLLHMDRNAFAYSHCMLWVVELVSEITIAIQDIIQQIKAEDGTEAELITKADTDAQTGESSAAREKSKERTKIRENVRKERNNWVRLLNDAMSELHSSGTKQCTRFVETRLALSLYLFQNRVQSLSGSSSSSCSSVSSGSESSESCSNDKRGSDSNSSSSGFISSSFSTEHCLHSDTGTAECAGVAFPSDTYGYLHFPSDESFCSSGAAQNSTDSATDKCETNTDPDCSEDSDGNGRKETLGEQRHRLRREHEQQQQDNQQQQVKLSFDFDLREEVCAEPMWCAYAKEMQRRIHAWQFPENIDSKLDCSPSFSPSSPLSPDGAAAAASTLSVRSPRSCKSAKYLIFEPPTDKHGIGSILHVTAAALRYAICLGRILILRPFHEQPTMAKWKYPGCNVEGNTLECYLEPVSGCALSPEVQRFVIRAMKRDKRQRGGVRYMSGGGKSSSLNRSKSSSSSSSSSNEEKQQDDGEEEIPAWLKLRPENKDNNNDRHFQRDEEEEGESENEDASPSSPYAAERKASAAAAAALESSIVSTNGRGFDEYPLRDQRILILTGLPQRGPCALCAADWIQNSPFFDGISPMSDNTIPKSAEEDVENPIFRAGNAEFDCFVQNSDLRHFRAVTSHIKMAWMPHFLRYLMRPREWVREAVREIVHMSMVGPLMTPSFPFSVPPLKPLSQHETESEAGSESALKQGSIAAERVREVEIEARETREEKVERERKQRDICGTSMNMSISMSMSKGIDGGTGTKAETCHRNLSTKTKYQTPKFDTFPGHFASLHVRYGMKVSEERLLPLSRYMAFLQHKLPLLRDVFVSTETDEVIETLIREYPDYRFYFLRYQRLKFLDFGLLRDQTIAKTAGTTTGGGSTDFPHEWLFSLANLYVAVQASGFVGSLTSNWCSMIHHLERTRGDGGFDYFSVDQGSIFTSCF